MKFLGIAVVLIILFMVYNSFKTSKDLKDITKIDGYQIIDVRTALEYNSGHIENALNIPYDIITNKISNHIKSKNQKIIVYCRSGRRSAIAKSSLIESGYTDVVDGGGFTSFKKFLSTIE